MHIASDYDRAGWLTEALNHKGNRIAFLLRRLAGLGAPNSMPPALFNKFRILLDQIAIERENEVRILNRIEAVEQQHRYRLANHQLEQAALAHNDNRYDGDLGEHPDRPQLGLLGFLVLWYLFMRDAINQKKQGLTVD